MKTRIIVDSTADVPQETKSRVTVVPMTVRFGDEEYVDGVTIDHKMFYEKLKESDVIPTTSQVPPTVFMQELDRVKAAGESAVVITMPAKLSGTYQSACIAASEYDNVYVVDSGNIAIAAGVLVELALRYQEQGLDAKEIAQRLEVEKKRIILVALVDTLEYLKKGGRVSKTVAFAGAMLNIKPVLSLSDGEITILGKARGTKMGNLLLMQEVEKTGGIDFAMPVLLGYTGLTDELLVKFIEEKRSLWDENAAPIRCASVGGTIGTHAGPGAIAVAFFRK